MVWDLVEDTDASEAESSNAVIASLHLYGQTPCISYRRVIHPPDPWTLTPGMPEVSMASVRYFSRQIVFIVSSIYSTILNPHPMSNLYLQHARPAGKNYGILR